MNNMTPQIVSNLGALHRAGVWENIALVVGLSAKGINVASSLLLPMDTSPDQSTVNLDDLDASISPSGANGVQPAPTTSTNTINVPGQDKSSKDPRERNAAALKHLTHGLPNSLAPFFQGIIFLYITPFSYTMNYGQRWSKCSTPDVIRMSLRRSRLQSRPLW
jgi:E3 ubiquitin-protein ligase HUWE1